MAGSPGRRPCPPAPVTSPQAAQVAPAATGARCGVTADPPPRVAGAGSPPARRGPVRGHRRHVVSPVPAAGSSPAVAPRSCPGQGHGSRPAAPRDAPKRPRDTPARLGPFPLRTRRESLSQVLLPTRPRLSLTLGPYQQMLPFHSKSG